MALAYQCIQARSINSSDGASWALFGASGPNIISQSSSGATSIWEGKIENTSEHNQENESLERPEKKIKLSTNAKQAPNVTGLVITRDGQYLVATTAEDKCVRVFHIGSDSALQPLTQRFMSRRPCAVTLASNDSTILCADKFGDVYALPLLQSPEEETEVPKTEDAPQKPYVPAASALTVHSGRNRRVLEDQLKQANKQPPKTKEPLKFKHDLLLGHVSMLTDIAYATVDAKDNIERPRVYILTADRDEHVRVSRGPPQAHIIEGFCQGHTEFVSRLCLTKTGPLVSGGGDRDLFLWDWLNCKLLGKVSINEPVLKFLMTDQRDTADLPESQDSANVAVSGIWSIAHGVKEDVVVTCEGVPALFRFSLTAQEPYAKLAQTVPLEGNALDVTFIRAAGDVTVGVVSIDNLHRPGSTMDPRQDEKPSSRLQAFSVQKDGEWSRNVGFEEQLRLISSQSVVVGSQVIEVSEDVKGAQLKNLRDIVYGIENLRKRGGVEE